MKLEIIQSGNQLQINGVTFPFSEKILIIEDITVLTPKTKGLIEFIRLACGVMSESYIMTLLEFMYTNTHAGIKELQCLLHTDRSTIINVLMIGYNTGIFVKKGQWSLVTRDAVYGYLQSKKNTDNIDVDEQSPLNQYIKEIDHITNTPIPKKKGK